MNTFKLRKFEFVILLMLLSLAILRVQPTTSSYIPNPVEISADFTFSEDLTSPLVVTAEKIMIEGGGITLKGPDFVARADSRGVCLEGRKQVQITNLVNHDMYLMHRLQKSDIN